jgi:gluconate 2-dehydrogenase gamma chain
VTDVDSLPPAQVRLLERFADHMVPADELGPGGTALGVVRYIERALRTPWAGGARQYLLGPWQPGAPSQGYQLPQTPAALFLQGTAAALSLLEGRFASNAEAADAGQLEALLQLLRDGDAAEPTVPPKEYFALLHAWVMEGVFADPRHGGNAAGQGWAIIGFPGSQGGFRDTPRGSRPRASRRQP